MVLADLRPGLWAASLDLRDAYLHIPIAKADQRFLAFRYRDRSFLFIHVPPVRAVHFTEGLHPGDEDAGSSTPKGGNLDLHVHRRLACGCANPPSPRRTYFQR